MGSTELEKVSTAVDVSVNGVKLTYPGLEIDEGLSRESWREELKKATAAGRLVDWCLGDLLAFGDRKWGDSYREASEITGHTVGSLRSMASISRRIPPHVRRLELSQYAHRPVAPLCAVDENGQLEYEQPVQTEWLDRAAREGWGFEALDFELKAEADARLKVAAQLKAHPVGAERHDAEAGLPEPCPDCGGTGVRR